MVPTWSVQEEVCYCWWLNFVCGEMKAICWWADHINKAVLVRMVQQALLIVRRFLIWV